MPSFKEQNIIASINCLPSSRTVDVCLVNQVFRLEDNGGQTLVGERNWRGVIEPDDQARAQQLLGAAASLAESFWAAFPPADPATPGGA